MAECRGGTRRRPQGVSCGDGARAVHLLRPFLTEDPAEPGLRWAGVISLEKAYSFDPKPAGLAPARGHRILGVEGCLWSEMLVAPDRPDYMAYPRVCALAEVAWTPQSERSWPDFWSTALSRNIWRAWMPPGSPIAFRRPRAPKRLAVTIIPPYDGAEVRYTLDGSEPGPQLDALHSAV
jgi:hexosaminidase